MAGPGSLKVSLGPHAAPIGLLDISAGGFAVASPTLVRQGDLFHVQFHLAAGPVIQLRAKCVHCGRTSGGDPGTYRVGFAFVTWSGEDARALARLMDDVTGVLSFE